MADTRVEKLEIEQNESQNIIDWIFIGFRRWKIFIGVFLILLLPLSYNNYHTVANETPVYMSYTKVMLAPVAFEVKSKTGDMVQRKYTIGDEIIFLQSKQVIQKAAGLLKTKYGYNKAPKILEAEITRGLVVKKSKDIFNTSESLVEISMTSSQPQKAHDSLSAVIEAYKLNKKDEEKIFFDETFQIFQNQIYSAHTALFEAENKMADFIVENEEIIKTMERYGLLSDIDNSTIISSVLNEKILKTRDDISALKIFIDSVDLMSLQDPVAAASLLARKYPGFVNLELRNKVFEKEAELSRSLQSIQEAHPEVMRIRGELNIIRQKMDLDILNALVEIRADLKKLEEQEKELSLLAHEGFYKKLIAYSMLKRSIVNNRDVYNNLSKALQEIDLGEKLKHYAELRIISPHTVPSRPKDRNYMKGFLLVLVISFVCGGGMVYIVEMLDTSIKDIEQLEKLIDLPVLAAIPLYRPRAAR